MNLEQFAKSAETLRVLGVVVTQDGKEIAKQVWDEECRRNVYSASKSFTSCAVGMAMKEGLLSLDEKLVDCFPDELPEQVSDDRTGSSDDASWTAKGKSDGWSASVLRGR